MHALSPLPFTTAALLFLTVQTPPCVPAGESIDLKFERPRLGQPGDPVNAKWNDTTETPPIAQEVDNKTFGSEPDAMGAASPVPGKPNQATVTVLNTGGDLSGPNGATVNGGMVEGSCIEVQVCWTYTYSYFKIKKDGDGFEAYELLATGTKCAPVQGGVCPC